MSSCMVVSYRSGLRKNRRRAARRWRETYRIWVVVGCDALAIEEESDTRDVLALTIAERIHELAECRCSLDLEEDLVVVVGDLDVEVLALTAILRLLLDVW